MFNPKWPTWINASVINHFSAVAETQSIGFYVEGEDRQTADENEYVELRLNGPTFTEESSGCFVIDLDISILVTVKKGGSDVYRPHKLAGAFIQQMIDIPIYDKGYALVPPATDYAIQFCMPLSPKRNHVRWSYFGQASADIALLQGAVIASYSVKL